MHRENGVILGVVLLAFLGGVQSAQSQGGGGLASAKGIYEKSLLKIEQEYQDAIKGLPTQYEKKLDELAATLQKKGDLDSLLAVNKEKARFQADRTVPDTTPSDLPADVAKLQEDHRTARGQPGKGKSQKIVTLTRQYLARLETMKKDLTTQGKLDDALVVREEVKRVEGSEVYAKAQQDAPAVEEAKPDKPDKMDGKVSESFKQGLVLHYSFDKDEGTTVKDLSGKNNDGRVYGAKWVPNGIFGGAYRFDGERDYILAGPVPAQGMPSELTLAVWVNPQDLTRKNYSTIITRNFGAGEAFGVRFDRDTLFMHISGGELTYSKDKLGPFRDGQWYHIVVTFSRIDNRAVIYCNGKVLNSGSPYRDIRQAIRGDLYIGRDNRDDPVYFKGLMDELRIYDRALTQVEVNSLYQLHGSGIRPGASTVIEAGTVPQPSTPAGLTAKLPRLQIPGGSGEKMDSARLYQRAVPAVVVVAGRRGHGSGIIVGRKDIVLTNAHVVGDDPTVKIYLFTYQGEKLKRLDPLDGDVIYRSEDDDIAVVKFDRGPVVAPLPVTRRNPAPGTKVFAFGSPGLGDLAVLEQSITEGIISSTPRDFGGHLFIQHTAAVNPGNSGGPLLNEQGEVVGMITLKAFLEGVSFAIPAGAIRDLFEKRKE